VVEAMREQSAAQYICLSVLGAGAVCFLSWLVSRGVVEREERQARGPASARAKDEADAARDVESK
jgi:hypothetical protein